MVKTLPLHIPWRGTCIISKKQKPSWGTYVETIHPTPRAGLPACSTASHRASRACHSASRWKRRPSSADAEASGGGRETPPVWETPIVFSLGECGGNSMELRWTSIDFQWISIDSYRRNSRGGERIDAHVCWLMLGESPQHLYLKQESQANSKTTPRCQEEFV